MPERYFELQQDLYVPGRWYLGEPTSLDGREVDDIWQFTEGRSLNIRERLRVPLYRPGKPIAFTTTGAGATPIIHPKVASVFAELAQSDVQLFPAEVAGQPEPYALLNVTRLVKCIDDTACEEVEYWLPEDERPEKTGTYRNVVGLRIDKARVSGAKVFRPWGWPIAIIVAEPIKEALERAGATGLKFTEV
ncbi:imm11 family protein [Pyxidicoccus sp. 3LG]